MNDETNSSKDDVDSAWGEAMAEQSAASTSSDGNDVGDSYEKAQFGQ